MKTLREQMNDAMILRGFAPRTQESYLAAVRALAKHYRRSPDTLSAQEVEAYHLHLIVERKFAYSSVNQSASACRFLFDKVLRRPQARFDIPMAKVPKSLPCVLSRNEASRLLAAAPNPRASALLMVTYAAGLRVTEVCSLQMVDIESDPDRMCIKVRGGKGGKDRYTLLSPVLFHFSINNEILNGILHLLIATEHRIHHIIIAALKDKWNYCKPCAITGARITRTHGCFRT